jgi:hypothetical protein
MYEEEHPDENIQDTKIFEYIQSNIEKKVTYEINRTLKDK